LPVVLLTLTTTKFANPGVLRGVLAEGVEKGLFGLASGSAPPGSAVGLFTFHGIPQCRAASVRLVARGHVGPGSNRRRIGWSVTRAIMS
jgi:hypothetical protein